MLASGITDLFLTSVLSMGTSYKFKVEARNAFGFSLLFSNEVTILQAEEPTKPGVPTTTVVGDQYVIIDWIASSDQGAALSSYTVLILTSDGVTYSEELNSCDGSDPTIISDATCNVLVADLLAAPFNLPYGSSIYAKVLATNLYGDSLTSDVGNGAVILTVPDAPTDLADDESQTNAN